MTDLYVIAGVLVLIVGGFYLIPFLKSKGVLNNKNKEQIFDALNVAEIVLAVLPIADKYKEKATFVNDIAKEVIVYVHEYANEALTDAEKKELSIEVTNRLLEEFGVNPTEEEMKLINIIIENGLKISK